jgi:hypothetical protein
MGVELLEIGLGVCNCNVAMYTASGFAAVLKPLELRRWTSEIA